MVPDTIAFGYIGYYFVNYEIRKCRIALVQARREAWAEQGLISKDHEVI